VHGVVAEEIFNNCDERSETTPGEQLTIPNLTLAQAFKRRNLATFKNLAQQKLQVSLRMIFCFFVETWDNNCWLTSRLVFKEF